ncbi:UNVERIFIED_CONTAM: hypothetical protein Scaly_1012700 [Sesamum calycinum]|uniref:RNase H type-1 domain-containing protein n=1 Tax=Sesamum calycinum TaxID=2727403 RepID=A0AAW2QJD6_9LAMI
MTILLEPVNYYWHEGDWNVPRILRTVPTYVAQIICQIHIAAGQGDKIVWTRSSEGAFSTKSAWETIRMTSPRRQLLTDVWHHSLRPTISVFLWQLFQDKIPIDARMKQMGFNFPSKCQCCEAFLTCLLRVRQYRTCDSTLLPLLDSASVTRERYSYGTLLRWNAAKYPGVPFSTDNIILELNTDESSLGNPGLAGAAGIIRDSNGHVHLAYQVALSIETSVIAELTAIWRSLELVLAHDLTPSVVEVDAMAVIQLLQSCTFRKWEVQHLIMSIVRIQQMLVSDFQHTLREANGAANHLAKEAASLQFTMVLRHDDITGVLPSILNLDR